MIPANLPGTNGLDSQGTSVSQSLSNNLFPSLPGNLYDPFIDPDSYTDIWNKLKSWFSSFGSSINDFANAFADSHPDSIFNIGRDPRTNSGMNGSFYEYLMNKLGPNNAFQKYDPKDYLKDTDLPDWVHDLFNNAIDMYYDNLNRQYTFNQEEAMKDRLWQEYMSNTAYLRAAEQFKELGINPLLAFGYGLQPASTPGGSTASGSLGNSNSLFGSIVSAASSDKKILASLLTAILGIFKVFSGKTSSSIISNNTNNNRSVIDLFNH